MQFTLIVESDYNQDQTASLCALAAAAMAAQCERIADLYFAADENMSTIRAWIRSNFSW